MTIEDLNKKDKLLIKHFTFISNMFDLHTKQISIVFTDMAKIIFDLKNNIK